MHSRTILDSILRLGTLALGFTLTAVTQPARAEVTWSEDFESAAALTNWSVSNGTWQIGIPTSGPGAPHGGLRCAATVLDGDYTDDTSSRIVSPLITVPSADQNPRLRFWNCWSISSNDFGKVQISTDDGATWTDLSGQYNGGNGSDGRWSRAWLTLQAYAGQTVRIGFYIEAHKTYFSNIHESGYATTVSSGWYIDDVAVEVGNEVSMTNPEGFENDWEGWRAQYAGGWATDSAIWEVGTPSSGPGAAHSGSSCLATILDGNYPDGRSSRMVSPALTVPAADQNPQLRFWHWWSISSSDFGKVQVSTDDGATWTDLSGQYGGTSGGGWTSADFSLTQFAGQSLMIGFYFATSTTYYSNIHSSGYATTVSSGWYIDDVFIDVDSINPADFPNRTVTENHHLTITTFTTLTNPEFSLKAGAPSGMTIHPATGRIDWTPAESQGPGYYTVTVELRQTGNNLNPVDRVRFEVQVLEENNTPVFPEFPRQWAEVGTPFTFDASGGDPDSANRPNRSLIARGDFDDLTLGVWTAYSVASNKNWTATEYDGRYAEMFGYAADVASEDWLISPVVNLDQYSSETLGFLSRWQYAGPDLDVLYSSDYSGSGNPNAATWTSLTAACAWPVVSNDWTSSGVVDLGGISGSAVCLAFRYKSTGTTNSTARLWQLDNIELIGTPVSVVNNTDVLTYSLLNAPAGMGIDPVTGAINWTPSAAQSGSVGLTVVASDNGVPSLSASRLLTVNVVGIIWQDSIHDPSGWLSLPWFGWFKETGGDRIYHLKHGWMYASGATTESFWLYDFALGCWWWTSVEVYPFLYKTGTDTGWYWFQEKDGTSATGSRWFYHYTGGQWQLVKEVDVD